MRYRFQTARVRILGHVAAGKPIELLPVSGYCITRAFDGLKSKDVACIRLVGDSLEEDHIIEGDWVYFRYAYEARNDQLVVALTPDGLTVKYYRPLTDGRILLRAAHPAYDQCWEAEEVIIQGVVLRTERDL